MTEPVGPTQLGGSAGMGTAASSGPRVSFVVINWKAEDATRACVESIRAQDADTELEVIVVDNETSEASREALGSLPGVSILGNRRNEGFTGGMNRGFAAATGSFVASVNNDALLDPSWLRRGLEVLSDPTIGMVGGVDFALGEGNPPYDTRNDCVTPGVDPVDGYTFRLPRRPVTADVVTLEGSNLLLRAEVLRRLGGFEPDFFAYYEDADLSARVLALGYRLRIDADMRVWHRRNLSSDRMPLRRGYLSRRNHLAFVSRHFPEATWRATVRRLSVQYLAFGVLGREAGLRARAGARRLDVGERLVCVASGAWGLARMGYLTRKRAQVVAAGQHSEQYQEFVAAHDRR